jgi:hypothetical protein
LRHDFLRVLWDRAIHGGNYINPIEFSWLINFIYSIGIATIGAWAVAEPAADGTRRAGLERGKRP